MPGMRFNKRLKKKMKHFKLLLPIITLISISVTTFTSCEKDDDEINPEQPTSRTVLIYMSAENSLDKNYLYDPVMKKNVTYYASDSAEIVRGAANLPDNVNLIVFADRSSKNVKPFIAKVEKDGMHIVKSYEKDTYTIDRTFMKEVINWTFTKYPADSYAMTFWGHGNGWMIVPDIMVPNPSAKAKRKAYGTDKGTDNDDGGDGEEKYINIPELASVLSSVPHLDYIFFDCCQMMCAEVAYELRGICDYIIGSPSEIPGFGAPYEYVVPDLFLAKDKVGKAIVDDYINLSNLSSVGGLPLSVVKTSNMDNLINATYSAIDTVMVHYPYPNSLPLNDVIFYGMNEFSSKFAIYYDLRNVMRKYLSEKDFNTWDDTFQKTVVYSVHPKDVSQTGTPDWNSMEFSNNSQFKRFTMNDENYGGLSMFIPQTNYQFVSSKYLNPNVSIKALQWNKVIDWTRYNWE